MSLSIILTGMYVYTKCVYNRDMCNMFACPFEEAFLNVLLHKQCLKLCVASSLYYTCSQISTAHSCIIASCIYEHMQV